MTGIADYFSLDSQELPVFKAVQNELKAHCHFDVFDGPAGQLPAWSGTVQDYVQLATALGANLDGLKIEATTDFLLGVQKRINATLPGTDIYVNEKGWVGKITALLPKTGIYRLKFAGARSVDGSEPLSFQDVETEWNGEKKINSVVYFQFMIVSDAEDGTDYAGTRFSIRVLNPWDGVMDGDPAWRVAKNGAMMPRQRQMMTFLGVYWPDAYDYKWVRDPEASPYGIDEAANPIVVVVDQAVKSGKQGLAKIEVTESGFIKLELTDLVASRSALPTTVKPAVQAPAAAPAQAVVHFNLIKIINDFAYPDIQESAIVSGADGPYTLTTKGGQWCKEKIGPLCDTLGYPRRFDALSSEQAAALVNAISKKYGSPDF